MAGGEKELVSHLRWNFAPPTSDATSPHSSGNGNGGGMQCWPAEVAIVSSG